MFSGCTDKNVHTTGLSDHLLFDHYRIYNLTPERVKSGFHLLSAANGSLWS